MQPKINEIGPGLAILNLLASVPIDHLIKGIAFLSLPTRRQDEPSPLFLNRQIGPLFEGRSRRQAFRLNHNLKLGKRMTQCVEQLGIPLPGMAREFTHAPRRPMNPVEVLSRETERTLGHDEFI